VKRPFYLTLRRGYWYYRLNRESGVVEDDDRRWRSTGCSDRSDAEQFVANLISTAVHTHLPVGLKTFRQYAAPFFIWGECPHIRRVLEETARYTERHARIQRGRLENHLFTDPFAEKRLSEITRADIFDLRSRLLKKNAPATVNKVIGVVKIILREAVIREELDRDPTEYVRNVKGKKRERGIFTIDELKKLFPEHGYGQWNNPRDYTCFYLAAVSGARRGELLVLRWRHIHFEQRFILITEAWKGRDKIGDTKSGRDRIVPLSDRMIEKLEALMDFSLHLKPDDFLFCYDDGKRVGETWWHKRFKTALKRAGIEPGDRWLTPHSFRHTINTIVRNSGHDPAKIRAVLGWMDEEIQDNYTHWEAEHLRRWAEIVDDIWE
jgi:integrase